MKRSVPSILIVSFGLLISAGSYALTESAHHAAKSETTQLANCGMNHDSVASDAAPKATTRAEVAPTAEARQAKRLEAPTNTPKCCPNGKAAAPEANKATTRAQKSPMAEARQAKHLDAHVSAPMSMCSRMAQGAAAGDAKTATRAQRTPTMEGQQAKRLRAKAVSGEKSCSMMTQADTEHPADCPMMNAGHAAH